MTMDTTNSRKSEAIEVIRNDPQTDRQRNYFDRLHLRHRALPELDLDAIDPSIEFLGKRLSFPLLISSMTGGADDRLRKINRNLAIAAEAAGVALGVGSQRVAFVHPDAVESFELRKYAPHAVLLSNLGAVQLNYGFGPDECRAAVDMLQADGLFLHLNPLQEAVQPEGNRNFSGLANRIGEAARALPVPVVLKEVGAGLSPEDAELAYAQGIRYLDVAGCGGTSWSRIENHRHPPHAREDVGLRFQDWGLPTPLALRRLAPFRERGVTLLSSGGVRTGLDMIKSLALGATLCGMAKPFLEPALESPDAVLDLIARLKREFTTALFLLGIATSADLIGRTEVLRPEDGDVF
ncbi:MAG: type 2 isopentenyl-diphosphate Delta-isomerase [Kiritimatiellae bacterium]|nr:type 2 isopentenyl-diphosphate Delta-isomerase [Kiritimatiellia bacterium]